MPANRKPRARTVESRLPGRPPAAFKPGIPPTVNAPPRSTMKPPPASKMKAAPRGDVPRPRRPQLVRDAGGGHLKDLFAMFPDLPRPPRPKARIPGRGARVARRKP